MQKQDNSGVIIAAVIGAFALIISALISYLGLRAQVETPINATRTAVAEANAPTAIPIAITQVSPAFTIVNSLGLAIEITVDGTPRGAVEKYSSKTFVLDRYPVALDWTVIRQSTGFGTSIGDEMQGHWDSIDAENVITIDNFVADQLYFYPILSNLTDQACDVIINDGLVSEYNTGAALSPNSSNTGFGYYKLFKNSNVTILCGDTVYWWGEREGQVASSGRIADLVAPGSGIVFLTHSPQ